MAVKLLEVPVHKARILLCNSRADALKIVKGHLYKDEQEVQDSLQMMKKACASSFESDGRVDWLLLFSRRRPQDVAHEAVHTGVMVLSDLGIAVTPETDEALAYLVDHIVEAFFKKEGWGKLEDFLLSEVPKPKRKQKRG